MTAVQLVQGTNKLNKATIQNGRSGSGMKVEHIRRTYFKGTMMMEYFAVVKSQTEPKGYSTIITFMNVAKAETLPNLDTYNVRVRCSCPDFFFCYAFYNKMHKALAGGVLRNYTRKTTTRPERNSIHTPGVCKHLIRQFITMRNSKLVTGGSVI